MDKKDLIIFSFDQDQCFFISTECPFTDFCWCAIGACFFRGRNGNSYLLSAQEDRLLSIVESFEETLHQALNSQHLEFKVPLGMIRFLARQRYNKKFGGSYEDSEEIQQLAHIIRSPYDYSILGMKDQASLWACSYQDKIILEVFGPGIPQKTDIPVAVLELTHEQAQQWCTQAQNLIGLMYNNEGFADPRTFPSNAIDSIENAAYCGCSRHGDPACKSHGPKEQEKQTIE